VRMRRVLTAALVMALVMLVSCTSDGGGGDGSSGGDVTLDYWVFDSGGLAGQFLDQLKSDFEKAHPNISLNITAYPEDNYGVKLDTAIAAGKEPDLVLVFGPEQMRQGLLLPLDDVVTKDNIDIENYVPAIVQPGDEFSCNYEGKLYCLGSYAGSTQMLYNKDLFDAAGIAYPPAWPPMTPEEFIADACKMTDAANGVWGGAASDPLAYVPFDMMFSPDGKTATGYSNGPDFVHQVEVLASGYDQGCLPTSNVMDPWEQGRDYFAEGKLAMVITDFQDLDKVEKAGINYGTTAVPTPAGVDPYFFVWTDSVGVMASSDHPDEAKEFIAYLTTEGQKIRYQASGDLPLNLQTAKDVNWAEGIPGREDGLEVLSHARPLVFVPNRWDVVGPYYDAWDLVLGGDKTAQEAMDDAAPAIQENLDNAWADWDQGA
jgi:multiple sugar transport system substrate-binding protein